MRPAVGPSYGLFVEQSAEPIHIEEETRLEPDSAHQYVASRPEEYIVETDETFSEKESSVTTVFSWSNAPDSCWKEKARKGYRESKSTICDSV